jgi:hypothetical protein
VKSNLPPHLAPRLRISEAIPLLIVYDLGVDRHNVTFTFTEEYRVNKAGGTVVVISGNGLPFAWRDWGKAQ